MRTAARVLHPHTLILAHLERPSQGASKNNIAFVLEEADVTKAVSSLLLSGQRAHPGTGCGAQADGSLSPGHQAQRGS